MHSCGLLSCVQQCCHLEVTTLMADEGSRTVYAGTCLGTVFVKLAFKAFRIEELLQ